MADNDELTYVVKSRDFADIIKLGDPTTLEEFLAKPASFVAETLTGFFAEGPKSLVVSGGRIVQGILKGQLFERTAKEIQAFRDKGKIPRDYADRKEGYRTWVELFKVIDEETPDDERLEALKAMFLATNRINGKDAERIVGYQLFQIAKKLTSGELLVLKATSEVFTKGIFQPGQSTSWQSWASEVCNRLGHGMTALVEHHEKALVNNQLLSPRHPSGTHMVFPDNARLTDLGIRFCHNLETYTIEKKHLGEL